MKTLEVGAVYPMAFGSFEDVAGHRPGFIDDVYDRRGLDSAPGDLSPVPFEDQQTRATVEVAA